MDVSRFVNRDEYNLTCWFSSPSFLGGATKEDVVLRSAPFKSLFRIWWRIGFSNKYLNIKDLLLAESELFGSVGSDKNTAASKFNVKLYNDNNIVAENINLTDSKTKYLGYGPISNKSSMKFLPVNKEFEIKVTIDKTANFSIDDFQLLVSLIYHFGSEGGRSRHGFGGLCFEVQNLKILSISQIAERTAISLENCFNSSYNFPHCLGKDEKGILVWSSVNKFKNYKEALFDIYDVYGGGLEENRDDNSVLKFMHNVDKRVLLAWPAKLIGVFNNHTAVTRVPSPLIFKIISYKDKPDCTYNIIHLPYEMIDKKSKILKDNQIATWKEIYSRLDKNARICRNRKDGTK